MSCPYYTFKDGDYHCLKQKADVNSDTYRRYCRDYNYDECEVYKCEDDRYDRSSSGCFLTSACTAARGLPDNCHELQTLRNFRDNWLKQQPDGVLLIARYYEIAPRIVAVIDTRDDRLEIYDGIYREMVEPCVALIGQGKYQKALEIYQGVTIELEKEYIEKG